MTFDEYKALKSAQNAIVDEISDKLNSYPKNEIGMVIESIRMSDEYRNLKITFDREFRKLRELNASGVKLFRKDIRKEYEEKYNFKK